jgi:uncharacterized Tic20 family protein
MGSSKNFFFVSCIILVLATINMGVGPIMNKKLGTSWGNANCEKMANDYEDEKKSNPSMDELTKEEREYNINQCKNKKTMYNMEYTSFVFNIVIGFIGVLIGLYGLQNEVIPKSGTIGMACGFVGLALTIVYVIFNIIVYTSYYDTQYYKVDSDGAFAEREGTRYKCYYFKEKEDYRSLFAKYSDLIKSQYNYNKELSDSFKNEREKRYGCTVNDGSIALCALDEYLDIPVTYINENNENAPCSKLYYHDSYNEFDDFSNYDKSARILTTLIVSILIILCYLGFIFSGFILNKESA